MRAYGKPAKLSVATPAGQLDLPRLQWPRLPRLGIRLVPEQFATLSYRAGVFGWGSTSRGRLLSLDLGWSWGRIYKCLASKRWACSSAGSIRAASGDPVPVRCLRRAWADPRPVVVVPYLVVQTSSPFLPIILCFIRDCCGRFTRRGVDDDDVPKILSGLFSRCSG